MTSDEPILNRICDALGITGPVSRVVIDCQVRSVCKVYVERYASGDQLADAAKAVADEFEVVEAKRLAVFPPETAGVSIETNP